MIQTNRIELINEMLQKEPNDPFLNYALALEYVKCDKGDQAIGLIEKILKKDANYLGAYYQLGKLYEESDQLDKAIRIYQKGMKIAEDQAHEKTIGELSEALMLLGADV